MTTQAALARERRAPGIAAASPRPSGATLAGRHAAQIAPRSLRGFSPPAAFRRWRALPRQGAFRRAASNIPCARDSGSAAVTRRRISLDPTYHHPRRPVLSDRSAAQPLLHPPKSVKRTRHFVLTPLAGVANISVSDQDRGVVLLLAPLSASSLQLLTFSTAVF